MMKETRIVAIGGAVIKMAWREIKQLARTGCFDVLIHNGGSIFHDFQRATEKLRRHSYSLDEIYEDKEILRKGSEHVWRWILDGEAPSGSLTKICQAKGIEVLLFSGMGTDFWQMFVDPKRCTWERFASHAWIDFKRLTAYMEKGAFHYICMGSAVIHPEVFLKALFEVKPKDFKADVVDFLDMYRPRTRVAKYGKYYQMEHKEFLTKILSGEIQWT